VTYSSLGESVEPGGKVDNYFVSGMCRYFFEDVHPRQSKNTFSIQKLGYVLFLFLFNFLNFNLFIFQVH